MWYIDYKGMLKRRNLQIVSVCTPPWLHKQMTLEAIRAGKHVICEKPMALTLKEADGMVKAAERADLRLAVDFHNRYLPQHQRAKELLDGGLIRRLFQVRCRVGYPFLDVLPPAAPMREWLFNPEKAGRGALMDIGSHWFDLTRWFVGSNAKAVSALVGAFSQKIGSVEDNAMILCEFENSVQALIDVSWTQKGGFWFVELYGLDGTIVCNGPQPIMMYTEMEGVSPWVKKAWIYPKLEPAEEPHRWLIREFVETVKNGEEPPVSGEDGRRAQEIITAAYESYKNKSVVHLPLER